MTDSAVEKNSTALSAMVQTTPRDFESPGMEALDLSRAQECLVSHPLLI